MNRALVLNLDVSSSIGKSLVLFPNLFLFKSGKLLMGHPVDHSRSQ